MAVLLMPLGNDAPFVDASGNPLSGGLIYFYTAGSSTPQDTFTTSAGNVANANPVWLNANGYPAPQAGGSVVEIWGTAGVQYKAILKSSAGVTVWTRDNLSLINDTTVSADQWLTGPTPTYIGATSFSLVGDQTSTFHVGRRVKTTNSGGTIYSTISASAFGAATTVTVVNDSGVLDSGLSAVSYGLLSATNFSVPALRAAGDWLGLNAAGTLARIPATATVAAHATTSDVWTARETILSGGAVTFTDIADAPYVGAVAWVKMNAAHIWTQGATFTVQGGATYTTAANDWVRIEAITVSTFILTIFPALGQPVSMQPITNSLSGDVALNNTGNYFTGPTVAQGTAGTWFASGTVTVADTAGAATFLAKLWDGTTVIASLAGRTPAAGNSTSLALSGFITSPAGNIRISVRDTTATSGLIQFDTTGEAKDSTLSAIRIR